MMIRSLDTSRTFVLSGLLLAAVLPLHSAQAKFATLYSFQGGGDGAGPEGTLLRKSGEIFGTTFNGGGSTVCSGGCGTVFEIAADGSETVLHAFSGSDGASPQARLIADAAGNLYSTTPAGGANGFGIVFELAPDGTETALYSFTGGSDGAYPSGGVIADKSGNLYGEAAQGGANNCGDIYQLAPGSTPNVIYSFAGGSDGCEPVGGLTADKAGNLYGTTSAGGQYNDGTVFRLEPGGRETVLYTFTGGNDGLSPVNGVIADRSGNLYMDVLVGADHCGLIFKVASDGTGTVLYTFTCGADGGFPFGNLLQDKAGNIYGTSLTGGASGSGTVYQLAPDGTETVLHSFSGSDGSQPSAGLIADRKGRLYGTAFSGGANGLGTVFRLKQ